ncbi:MAG: hypothetical protein A2Y40_01365 [Candidatus Margulisbacteria bacterium GWF2_35_9]|nr:MAG: hypothetical protein A2Y40_01365 [Candidatus Margulisbacteria bacterium GWF2_35_9]
MKLFKFTALLLIVFSFIMALDYAPNEIIVKLKPESSGLFSSNSPSKVSINNFISKAPFKISENKPVFKSKETLLQSSGKLLVGTDGLQNVYRLILDDTTDIESAIKWLKSQEDVVYAELNYITHAVGTVPNDTSYAGAQKTIYDKYNMEDAWDISTGSSSILVAVVDTGVNYNHPDLSGKVDLGFNYVDWNHNPLDDNGHGSHVAGIIAAKSNNSIGVAGMAWNNRILAIKVLDNTGHGLIINAAEGIEEAVLSGAHVINMSLASSWVGDTGALQDAINFAYANGVLLVVAASNEGKELYSSDTSHMMSPICNDGGSNMILGVASVGTDYTKSSFSNYSGEFVDISAIGESVYSTVLGSSYQTMSGTSMATPMVSGLAALILSTSPNLITHTSQTVKDVRAYILSSATDIDGFNPTYTGKLGYGLINAYNSLYLLKHTSSNVGVPSTILEFFNYPNPVKNSLTQTNSTRFHVLLSAEPISLKLSIYSYSGRRIISQTCQFNSVLISSSGEDFIWDLKDDNGSVLPPGVYIAILEVSDSSGSHKDYHKVVIK